MRLVPFLLAAAATAFIAIAVLQRERLMEFAQRDHLAMALGTEEQAPENGDTTDQAGSDQNGDVPANAGDEAVDASAGELHVLVQRSQSSRIETAVVLRGETEAARQVDVRAETAGPVISEPLRKGAFVSEGDVLCEIDPATREITLAEATARLDEARAQVPTSQARVPEAQARLAEARARLEEAQINANAARKLRQDGFSTETRVASTAAAVSAAEAGVSSAEAGLEAARAGLESAQAAIRSAQAGVAAAQKEIERLTVRAPFSGLLESDTAELGSLMSPGSLCATIIQLDPIKLVGFVPESDVSRVQVGAPAGARLSDGSDVLGRVSFLSRSADERTRTFRTEIEVPNDDLSIRDGQSAEIMIEADGVLAHLIPQSALTLADDGVLGVRAVDEDDIVVFYPVTLLRDTAAGAWVDGLPDEIDVVVRGHEYVVDGVRVVPRLVEPTEGGAGADDQAATGVPDAARTAEQSP